MIYQSPRYFDTPHTYFEYDDAWNLLTETTQLGDVIVSYTYDEAGRPVSMYQPDSLESYYFHYNEHGDVVALTDEAGAIAATYSYDPWGNVTSEWYASGTIRNPFRYGGAYGYYYDAETGLYYLRARYYKANVYRFISKDPDGGDRRDPLSLNPYLYCNDNPINRVDPSGLRSVSRSTARSMRRFIGLIVIFISVFPFVAMWLLWTAWYLIKFGWGQPALLAVGLASLVAWVVVNYIYIRYCSPRLLRLAKRLLR